MERVKKALHAALTIERQSLCLPDDGKRGSWFHQTSSSKHGQDLREPFVWSGRLHHSLLPATSIYVEDFGELHFPIQNQVFSNLICAVNSAQGNLATLASLASDGCCFIPASKIIPVHKRFKLCTSQLTRTAIEKALAISLDGLNFSFDCCFTGLVLSQPGQKVSLFHHKISNPGLFATVFLDIPVEDGFTGGTLKAMHEGFETDISYDARDLEQFYVTIVSQDNTSAVLEPILEGKRALMTFHVTWPDATLLGDWFDSRLVPTLLSRARRVRDSLPSHPDEKIEYFSREEATGDSELADCKQLVFPLKYHQSMNHLVSYWCLPPEDRFALTVLSLVNCLDASLTILKTNVDATTENLSAQVQQWYPSINGFPAPKESFVLDANAQMIGSLQGTLEKELNDSVECYDYFHAVVIVQPRCESIRLSCLSSFHAVLEHLEKRIPELLRLEIPHRDSLLELSLKNDLAVVLDFCRKNPLQVWCKPTLDLNITKRLLQLCLRLKASHLGTQLLETLSLEVSVTSTGEEFDLGALGVRESNGQYFFCHLIRDQDIVRLIADFVSNVAGWEACSGAILSLITLDRLYGGRLFLISYLAQQLHVNGLGNACLDIVQKVASVLSSITRDQAYGFGPCDTRPFVVLILYLMDSVKQEERHQFLPLLSFYSKFDPYDLYYMVVGFKWQFDRMIDTCPDLYRELCRLLSVAAFETSERLCDIDLVELVKTFQQAGDPMITEALLNNVCLTGAQDEPSNTPLLLWSFSTTFGSSSVEKEDVDDGYVLLKAISPSQQAREVIVKWLDTRVIEVDDFVDKAKDVPPASLRRRYDYFIKEVTCYFVLAVLAEKVPVLSNPARFVPLGTNLPKFSTKLLCHLSNVAGILEEEMAGCEAVQAVFSRLTQELESRDENEVVKQMARMDLVHSIVSEGDSMMYERTFATETAYSDDDCEDVDDCDEKSEEDNSLAVDADR